MKEVDSLLRGLEPTMPVFLSNLLTTNQVLTANIPALRQTLVAFPYVIASGFTGTPGDGYGHINLQFDNSVGPCTEGYKPNENWREGTDLTDGPVFPATCKSGPSTTCAAPSTPPASGRPPLPDAAIGCPRTMRVPAGGRRQRRDDGRGPREDCARCSGTTRGNGC